VGVRVTWSRSLGATAQYDAFVDASPQGAYPQASAYAQLGNAGRAFSPRFFMARNGSGDLIGTALVLRAVGPLGLPLPAAVVERGPVCTLSDLRQVLDALHRKARARGIIRLSVMPYFAGDEAAKAEEILASAGFSVDHTFSSAHARTVRVSLTGKAKGAIFAGKDGQAVRQKHNGALKAGATARKGGPDDVAALQALYATMMEEQRRKTKADEYFAAMRRHLARSPERAALFVTEHQGDVVSAAFITRHGAVATYVMGASSNDERDFTKAAPTFVAAAEWALEQGCAIFDLGGIPMEGDTDPKRLSIASFKTKFAKTPTTLVREHVIWL
jgi:lipid II:glycine glycyltransferase (peptidoglycan interpeptide bridge formation enzyme)